MEKIRKNVNQVLILLLIILTAYIWNFCICFFYFPSLNGSKMYKRAGISSFLVLLHLFIGPYYMPGSFIMGIGNGIKEKEIATNEAISWE